MMCQHCASRIKKGLAEIEGLSVDNIDVESKIVTVSVLDAKSVSADDILNNIKTTGFNPSLDF